MSASNGRGGSAISLHVSIFGLAISLAVSALIVANSYGRLSAQVEALDQRVQRIERNFILMWEPQNERR